jgi:hypothetical protein
MKLRTLRQWPALFVAVLALFTGPLAYGADGRSVAAFVSGAFDDAAADRAVLGEVAALCAEATVKADSGYPDAREFRELADAIDAVVTRVMDRSADVPVRTQRALAGLVLAADAMRSTDNRIRKAALAGLAPVESSRVRDVEADSV